MDDAESAGKGSASFGALKMDIYSQIKKIIPERIKRNIALMFYSCNSSPWAEIAQSENRKAYVFLAGFYQNLGDMAITYAQIKFIQQVVFNIEVIAVPANQTYTAVKVIKKYIKKDDLITIIGGGNMSDQYQSLEDARLHVVKSFPNNRIVSFPQTIEFISRNELRKSRRVYSSHKRLTLFAREPISYERAKGYFQSVEVEEVPDIVLVTAAL